MFLLQNLLYHSKSTEKDDKKIKMLILIIIIIIITTTIKINTIFSPQNFLYVMTSLLHPILFHTKFIYPSLLRHHSYPFSFQLLSHST